MEERDLQALMACPLFAQQGEALGDLAREGLESPLCSVRLFEKGEVIYGPAHFERSLGVLSEGQCEVTKETADGRRLVISRLGTGVLFGAAALFNREAVYPTEIRALSRCRVIFWPEELFQELFHKEVRLAEAYINYLCGRIHFLTRRIDALTAGSAERKLASYLAEQAQPRPEGGYFLRWSSAARLSQTLNIGRASLYRAIDQLTAERLIQKESKTLCVPDMERLKKYLEEEILL